MMTKLKNNITLLLIYIFFGILLITTVYPLVWIVGSSFNPGDSLFSSTMIPKKPTLSHYIELFQETDYKLWYWNTVKIATANMLLSTTLVIMAAYAFSRYRFKGRRGGLMAMLVLQMFPGFLSIIAIFVLLLQTGLLNTHLGLILVYAGGSIPFGAWLVKGYFDSIPRSLEEAAKIDGASNVTIFTKIILPLSTPIITFIALISFIGPWMDFILPQVVLRSPEMKTLAQGLYGMVSGRGNTNFTMFAAGAVLVALPITILYMYFQKYLIEGLTAGANKG